MAKKGAECEGQKTKDCASLAGFEERANEQGLFILPQNSGSQASKREEIYMYIHTYVDM